MDAHVTGLDDQDLADLGLLYHDLADAPDLADTWRRHFAGQAETVRTEQARRRLERAMQRDPLGVVWFGRL
jgi:hypothetical protein